MRTEVLAETSIRASVLPMLFFIAIHEDFFNTHACYQHHSSAVSNCQYPSAIRHSPTCRDGTRTFPWRARKVSFAWLPSLFQARISYRGWPCSRKPEFLFEEIPDARVFHPLLRSLSLLRVHHRVFAISRWSRWRSVRAESFPPAAAHRLQTMRATPLRAPRANSSSRPGSSAGDFPSRQRLSRGAVECRSQLDSSPHPVWRRRRRREVFA